MQKELQITTELEARCKEQCKKQLIWKSGAERVVNNNKITASRADRQAGGASRADGANRRGGWAGIDRKQDLAGPSSRLSSNNTNDTNNHKNLSYHLVIYYTTVSY